MNTPYFIYRANGTEDRGSLDWPKEPGHERIIPMVKAIINEPAIHISVLFDGYRADMFVEYTDEVDEGVKLKNVKATEMYCRYLMSKGVPEQYLPTIRGDVVVFPRRIWF